MERYYLLDFDVFKSCQFEDILLIEFQIARYLKYNSNFFSFYLKYKQLFYYCYKRSTYLLKALLEIRKKNQFAALINFVYLSKSKIRQILTKHVQNSRRYLLPPFCSINKHFCLQR